VTRIRDLDEKAFEERYRCDRFTATVLGNRYRYIVEHMCSRLLTAAFSPILRDFYDFAATLAGTPAAGYPTPAMSNSILLFTGTMMESVRVTLEEYGPERLEPGDVIVANDPYRGGTHVNDVLFTRPVFVAGELVGFVNLKAHQLDMGGVVPGGFTLTKSNVYEDGLVLSPRALFKARKPVPETWSLIFDNVRFGEILFPDMESICAELDLGERLFVETVERYGVEAAHGAMRYVCDASAERMQFALEAMPDGEWVGEDLADCDALDDAEEYLVRVKITKRGSRAEVDFSGSSRQARTCINCTPLDAKTTVGIAFKYLLDPQAPFTSGTMRCVDLLVPQGSTMGALPPNGAVFAYWEMNQLMIGAVLRALAQALGPAAMGGDRGSADIHNANGLYPDGTPWVSAAQVGGEVGPFGANAHGDADSNMLSYQANGLGTAVEAIESGAPVVVLRHEIVADAAGPGTHRGGTSLMRDSLWLQPAEHHLMSIRYKRASGFGVNGGADGKTGGIWIWPPGEDGAPAYPAATLDSYVTATPVAGVLDPETNEPTRDGRYLYPYRVPSWHTSPMSVLRYVNNGGGGWGDPFARDPELVKRDVRDGYVSVEGAARDYGVVVVGDPENDPEGLAVHVEATRVLREARSR
jgi:N-methylhydantoinase B